MQPVALRDNTYFLDHDALIIAKQVRSPRSSYQDDLINGRARWSGADIRGRARKYGGHYAARRDALIVAMRRAGLTVTFVDGPNGRLTAVVSSEPARFHVEGPRSAPVLVVDEHPALECGTMEVL